MTAPASIYVDPATPAGQLRAALDAIVWGGAADWCVARALLALTPVDALLRDALHAIVWDGEADWSAARALLDATTDDPAAVVADGVPAAAAAFLAGVDEARPAHLDYGLGDPPAGTP